MKTLLTLVLFSFLTTQIYADECFIDRADSRVYSVDLNHYYDEVTINEKHVIKLRPYYKPCSLTGGPRVLHLMGQNQYFTVELNRCEPFNRSYLGSVTDERTRTTYKIDC